MYEPVSYNLCSSKIPIDNPMNDQVNRDDILLVSDKPIVPEDVTAGISWDECGALITFTGRVRGYSEGKRVISLEHEATGYGAEKLMKDFSKLEN